MARPETVSRQLKVKKAPFASAGSFDRRAHRSPFFGLCVITSLIDRNARRLDTLAASATFALKDDLIAALQGISPVLATVSDLPAFGG